jgi:hypothetical protein
VRAEAAERYRATVIDLQRLPLLFLDIDGTLLPFGGNPRPGVRRVEAVPGLAQLRPDTGFRLAALPCILVWATAWQQDANAEIAPRIGLPNLPVVNWPDPTAAHESEDRWLGLCWKTRTLVDWAAGRPFAWVDDEITTADQDWVSEHHPGPALLHRVDAVQGLTDQDFDALNAWLREAA